MRKKMTFRKKSLAVMLSLMMGVAALTGCGKEAPAEPEVTEEEEEGSLSAPEVDGEEDTVGVFSLLIPDGMEANEMGNPNSICVVKEDDDEKALIIQIAEKDEAKTFVKDTLADDENFKETEFTLEGIKWSGASYKKQFCIYAKVDKKTVFVTGMGFKPTDDKVLAILASLAVDAGAEAVPINGGGSASASNGGVFTYGDGLYTVNYSGNLREADHSSEFGDLVSTDGNQVIYVTGFDDWEAAFDKMEYIESFDHDMETINSNGEVGYLYTYEDFWGDLSAEFILPLTYRFQNGYGSLCVVYIYASGTDYDSVVTEDFRGLIDTLSIDPQNGTDETYSVTSSGKFNDMAEYWERGWYGWWIVYDANEDYADSVSYAYDSLATFDVDGEEVHMQVVDDEGDLDVDVYLDLTEDSTDSGWLIANSGQILGYDIGYYDFYIDPESDSYVLDDYISFDVDLFDENEDWVCRIKGFFRPWGADFADFEQVSSDKLPYIFIKDDEEVQASALDMYPFCYEDWYVPQMNSEFPGLYAIEGANE